MRYADDSIHDVVFHKAVFHDKHGQVDGLAGAILDITDRKLLETNLQIEKAAAEKANSAKTRFLASASHDLREADACDWLACRFAAPAQSCSGYPHTRRKAAVLGECDGASDESLALDAMGMPRCCCCFVDQLHSHLRLPDLIISDYRLSDSMDGIKAIHQLRTAIGESIPALIVTGDITPVDMAKLETYRLPVLHKPVNVAALLAKLVSLFNQRLGND